MKSTRRWQDLTLADDFMFGKVMTIPYICKGTLERILGVEIAHIEYPERQKTIDVDFEAKGVRMDVYVRDGKGTVYNIEMQLLKRGDLVKRSRYYQGVIDVNLLEKGARYEDLNRSIIIFVCDFDLFGQDRHIYTFENVCIQDHNLHLNDGTTKIFLNARGTLDDISDDLKELLNYIHTGVPSEDSFVQEIDAAVRSARANMEWSREYMKLALYLQEERIEAREQGLEEGRQEGRLEGRQEGLREGRQEGRQEGRLEGRLEGRELMEIALIRKKYVKGLSCDDVADILETQVSYVEKVYNIIQLHPEWTDEQVYEYLNEKNKE